MPSNFKGDKWWENKYKQTRIVGKNMKKSKHSNTHTLPSRTCLNSFIEHFWFSNFWFHIFDKFSPSTIRFVQWHVLFLKPYNEKPLYKILNEKPESNFTNKLYNFADFSEALRFFSWNLDA